VLISNRRNIPYRLAVRLPSLAVIDHFIRAFGHRLPEMAPPPPHLFYECWIGILLMHRDLWRDCGGYDERFIYMDFMEMDIVLRLSDRYQVVDLGELVDCSLYHLNHEHPRISRHVNREMRQVNPWRTLEEMPEEFAPNGTGWGLASYDLDVLPVEPGLASAEIESPSLIAKWPAFTTLSLIIAAQTVADGLYRGSRQLGFHLFTTGRGYVKWALIKLGLFHVVARHEGHPQ
jgi:hypothetical protein